MTDGPSLPECLRGIRMLGNLVLHTVRTSSRTLPLITSIISRAPSTQVTSKPTVLRLRGKLQLRETDPSIKCNALLSTPGRLFEERQRMNSRRVEYDERSAMVPGVHWRSREHNWSAGRSDTCSFGASRRTDSNSHLS